jgi:phosphatidylglycerophosphate synthase
MDMFGDAPIATDPNLRIVPLTDPHPRDRANFLVEFCLARNISANHITVLRILLTPVMFLLIRFDQLEWSVVLLVLLTLSDALDGQVARTAEKRHPGKGVTPLGKILDPFSDKFLVVGTLLVMPWVPGYVLWPIVGMEAGLVLVRPLQKWLIKVRGTQDATVSSNDFGKTKVWLEDIMLIAFILEKCNPHYLQLWMFGGSIILGTLSLFFHLRAAFAKH